MDGQATACWISPCRCNVARPSTCWQEKRIGLPPRSNISEISSFPLQQGVVLPRQQRPAFVACVIVWAPVSIGGLAIRIQDKSIRDHHGPWRGPRAACHPVALPRCSGSSLPRVPLRSASPLRRSPFPVRGHGLGPDPLRHAPSSERRTTSTSVGLNLDISQLSKICPSRRNMIFMVNDEKTALLPQAAATKSIRPLWGNPVPRTERHRPSFCSGFASPSSCPSARPSRWQQS